MFPYCARNFTLHRRTLLRPPLSLHHPRKRCSPPSGGQQDQVASFLQLCVDSHYISPGQRNIELFQQGNSCSYGPLGTELKRNLLERWWRSMSSSPAQVFGINTINCSEDDAAGGQGRFRVVEPKDFEDVFKQEQLSKEEVIQKVRELLQRSSSLRASLFQGALEEFVTVMELVNRRLPFGLAETGLCFQPSRGSGCPAEVTQTSLVWFCSPRTSSQWLDHWTRQRLKWWRKFALSPSDFSSTEVAEEELEEPASHGVRILYRFPWGQEPLETLWMRGNSELLQMHKGVRSKLQSRDGRKSIPHVISVSGNVDRGMMAFLSNSLQQQHKKDGSTQKLQQRKVLKLHPVLAPVKVALEISRGATVELRQVCEGLALELLEAEISVWPGYLKTQPASMQQLTARYDEMGVLFTVVTSENTLESGLLQVRSRDTAVKETMHISEIKKFLLRYVSAADNS